MLFQAREKKTDQKIHLDFHRDNRVLRNTFSCRVVRLAVGEGAVVVLTPLL